MKLEAKTRKSFFFVPSFSTIFVFGKYISVSLSVFKSAFNQIFPERSIDPVTFDPVTLVSAILKFCFIDIFCLIFKFKPRCGANVVNPIIPTFDLILSFPSRNRFRALFHI